MTAVAARGFAPGPPLSRLFAIELRKTVDTRAGFWLLVSSALAVLGVAAVTLAAASQKPARVSTILRSSTAVRRPMLGRAPASRPVIGMSSAAALALIGQLRW